MKVTLPQPKQRPDLLIIAGEHSGDQHAANMLRDLKKMNPNLHVCALGGPELQRAGANLLFDLTASSVVGLFEVLKNYSFFKDLFDQTVAWIREHKPKAICFVDYPGFNLRLAKKLYSEGLAHKAGGPVTLYYYIGPQIWAWKKKRRFAMAKYLDSLAVIFPFEVDCYNDTDLNVHFVGHPFLQEDYISPVNYDPDGPILLLPGSRQTPVQRILPTILDAFELILNQFPNEHAIIVYPTEKILNTVNDLLNNRPHLKNHITLKDTSKPVSGKAIIGSSGTMSLACALAGIPGTILYKANPFTYFLGRIIVDIDRLGMANILLNQDVYPEYIQHKATPKALFQEILDCLSSDTRHQKIAQQAQALKSLLSNKDNTGPDQWLGSFCF